jgi:hypothetical protein
VVEVGGEGGADEGAGDDTVVGSGGAVQEDVEVRP